MKTPLLVFFSLLLTMNSAQALSEMEVKTCLISKFPLKELKDRPEVDYLKSVLKDEIYQNAKAELKSKLTNARTCDEAAVIFQENSRRILLLAQTMTELLPSK